MEQCAAVAPPLRALRGFVVHSCFDFPAGQFNFGIMAHAILTAIGVDRAGLVDEISRYIFDRGGNIEESRMVNLRGQFAS